MSAKEVLPHKEETVLRYLLRISNYRTTSLILQLSKIANDLGLDVAEFAHVLRVLSARGLVRPIRLPRSIEETIADQIWDDLDLLDLRHLERNIAEPEYASSRLALSDELRLVPHSTEMLSPREAARLFRKKERMLDKILQLGESSQTGAPSAKLESDLLSIRKTLIPFKEHILLRINKLKTATELRPDPQSQRRMKMLLLFSQVGLSQLVSVCEMGQDLKEELEVLRARHLVGELSESDLGDKEDELWAKTSPELPSDEAIKQWQKQLSVKLDAIESLRKKGLLTQSSYKLLAADLNEDIALFRNVSL